MFPNASNVNFSTLEEEPCRFPIGACKCHGVARDLLRTPVFGGYTQQDDNGAQMVQYNDFPCSLSSGAPTQHIGAHAEHAPFNRELLRAQDYFESAPQWTLFNNLLNPSTLPNAPSAHSETTEQLEALLQEQLEMVRVTLEKLAARRAWMPTSLFSSDPKTRENILTNLRTLHNFMEQQSTTSATNMAASNPDIDSEAEDDDDGSLESYSMCSTSSRDENEDVCREIASQQSDFEVIAANLVNRMDSSNEEEDDDDDEDSCSDESEYEDEEDSEDEDECDGSTCSDEILCEESDDEGRNDDEDSFSDESEDEDEDADTEAAFTDAPIDSAPEHSCSICSVPLCGNSGYSDIAAPNPDEESENEQDVDDEEDSCSDESEYEDEEEDEDEEEEDENDSEEHIDSSLKHSCAICSFPLRESSAITVSDSEADSCSDESEYEDEEDECDGSTCSDESEYDDEEEDEDEEEEDEDEEEEDEGEEEEDEGEEEEDDVDCEEDENEKDENDCEEDTTSADAPTDSAPKNSTTAPNPENDEVDDDDDEESGSSSCCSDDSEDDVEEESMWSDPFGSDESKCEDKEDEEDECDGSSSCSCSTSSDESEYEDEDEEEEDQEDHEENCPSSSFKQEEAVTFAAEPLPRKTAFIVFIHDVEDLTLISSKTVDEIDRLFQHLSIDSNQLADLVDLTVAKFTNVDTCEIEYLDFMKFYERMAEGFDVDGPLISLEFLKELDITDDLEQYSQSARKHQKLFNQPWKSARKCLEEIHDPALTNNYENIVLCKDGKAHGAAQLLVAGLATNVPFENIHSTESASIETVLAKIQQTYGADCIPIVITSSDKTICAAKMLQIPIWRVERKDSFDIFNSIQKGFLLS